MAYGVIGNTTVSGTVILGSSPGRPAVTTLWSLNESSMPRSSRGLGRRPLTAVTRVQIPYGVQRSGLSRTALVFNEAVGENGLKGQNVCFFGVSG